MNGCFHQLRFIVALFGGLACGVMLFHRYSMTIAILQMVNQTHLYLEEHPNSTLQDFQDEGLVSGGEFPWNNEIVAIILGWYMFSYTLPQAFMAKWNLIIGCRLAIPIELTLCSLSSLLTPSAAYMGWKWVVACRLLNGFGAAGILPGMISLLENWMRYNELSLALTISTLVSAVMVAICPLIEGYLTDIHWSIAFYAPGYATLLFCALWLVLITEEPEKNWLISKRELDYLNECEPEDATGGADEGDDATVGNDHDEHKPDSWLQIFKLTPFYAYLLYWISTCICNTGFIFILPAYLQEFLKIPISENGFYCFIINLGGLIAVLWPHQLVAMLLRINLTTTQARIIAQGVCNFLQAFTYISVGLFHQYQLPMFFLNRCSLASDVLFMASVMSNFAKAGLSSLVFAMINTIGNLAITFSSPMIGKWLDYTGSSPFGWRLIFIGFGLAQLVIFLLYAFFIDSEPIKFNDNKRNNKCEPSKS